MQTIPRGNNSILCKQEGLRVIFSILFIIILVCSGAVDMVQAETFYTSTLNITTLTNDQTLGCSAACGVTRTPGPLRSDDVQAASLPLIIRRSLTPPASQDFGVNYPQGALEADLVTFPVSGNISEPAENFTQDIAETFNSTLHQTAPSIKRTNNINGTITQRASVDSGKYQFFNYQFDFNSLTDSNGELLGTAGNQDGRVRGSINMTVKEGSSLSGSGASDVIPQHNFNITWSPAEGPIWN